VKGKFLAVALILPLSCSGVKAVKRIGGQAVMYGMVYDDENLPVKNAVVAVDGKPVTATDVQGRFILISKKRETFAVAVEKSGYEKAAGEFVFDPMDVLHFKLVNADQLLYRAEQAMDERRFAEAIVLCDRALALEAAKADAVYLKALAYYQLRDYKQAASILEYLESLGGKKTYIDTLREALK
jgi:hypothetical protein